MTKHSQLGATMSNMNRSLRPPRPTELRHLTVAESLQIMTPRIRVVPAGELDGLLHPLTESLRETVNAGSPLGFLAPLRRQDALEYWLSLRRELEAGSRLLLVASTGAEVVGSGQLVFPPTHNGRHRAELQKLFVATHLRGLGVGRSLVAALHDTARQHGRSLLVLNTRRGDSAEGFYKGLGYREVGVLPGWTVGSEGERYDHVTLYQELSL